MLKIHLTTLDPELVPQPSQGARPWYARNPDTARFADDHPLDMANTAGWLIRSPGTFQVTWDGNLGHRADVTMLDASPAVVTGDVAAFTVDPGFIPATTRAYEFVWVKAIPNLLAARWQAMERIIEAWRTDEFQPITCLLTRPGTFIVERGEPIAQMVSIAVHSKRIVVTDEPAPPGRVNHHVSEWPRPGSPEARQLADDTIIVDHAPSDPNR